MVTSFRLRDAKKTILYDSGSYYEYCSKSVKITSTFTFLKSSFCGRDSIEVRPIHMVSIECLLPRLFDSRAGKGQQKGATDFVLKLQRYEIKEIRWLLVVILIFIGQQNSKQIDYHSFSREFISVVQLQQNPGRISLTQFKGAVSWNFVDRNTLNLLTFSFNHVFGLLVILWYLP